VTGILGQNPNAKQATAVGTLQFQTSQVGGVIPLVYGATRVAVNLLDYQDFTATPVTGKQAKGKGSADAKGQGKYTYSASLILGICQGPVQLGLVWWERNVSLLVNLPGISTINLGNDDQPPDPYWETNHPGDAIGYSGTANFTADNYQLGYSAALPNFTVEVLAAATSVNGSDANPANILVDFLTNARYGAGFPAANLDQAGTLTNWAQYCDAAGIWLSPMLDQQTQAQQALANLAALSVSALVWSGGLLKVIPYGDAPIDATYWIVQLGGVTGAGDTLALTFSSVGLGTVSVSYQTQPANVNTDAVDPSGPMGRLAQQVNGTPALTNYGITAGVGVGATVIRMAGADQSVAVSAMASQIPGSPGAETFTILGPFGRSWTPDTTVWYSLDDDDFIVQQSSVGAFFGVSPGGAALRQGAGPITGGFTSDPLRVSRSSPADAMNYVALECLDRAYGYNTQIVETFDQSTVDNYGVRKDTSVKARAIADPLLCGAVVAQLILQRNLAYRNTYTFSLGWNYCLLEPMDLVAISDSYLGINNNVVRITSVHEDEEGTLTFTAEDFLGAAGGVVYGGSPGTAPPLASKQGFAATTYVPNYANPAPPVSTPFMFEPTPQLLMAQGLSTPQIVIGLAAPGAIWGGAAVYASLDNASFGPQGTFIGRSTIGVSTLDLAASGASLTVDLSASSGSLSSVSPLAAANGVSLCAIRGASGQLELLSFTTATLVAGNVYTLTGLYRGLYGTPVYDQPAGAQFLYLGSGQYFAQVLPPQYVGHNLWFKFPSFNLTGSGAQSMAQAMAYLYTPVGAQLNPNQITARFAMAIEAQATSQSDPAAQMEHQ
jgi:Putative phage tail protein